MYLLAYGAVLLALLLLLAMPRVGVFPDAKLGVSLAAWASGIGTLTVKLAKNNVTITRATVIGDFTEANFTGYASQNIGSWGSPIYDGTNHRYSIAAAALTWTNTLGVVGNDIYAVYVVDASGNLIWAEEVTGGPSSPVSMNAAGNSYSYTPVVDDSSRASTSP